MKPRQYRLRQALAFRADDQRHPPGAGNIADFGLATRRKAPDCKTSPGKPLQHRDRPAAAVIGNREHRPDGNPQRLAIERIAARLVQQHRIGIKGCRIAEHGTEIVVVGDAAADEHQRRGGKCCYRLFQPIIAHAPPERQNAAMQVETDNTIQHRRFRHVNRDIIGDFGKDIRNAGKTVAQDQDAFRRKGPTRLVSGSQHAQHHRTLGNETPLPAGEITLANVAKGGNARVGRVFNRDQRPLTEKWMFGLTGHQQSHPRGTGRWRH
ncbi:hypothetical protein AT6N2_C3158 [Agrobacterium tumefaciens]|nr:hypothetical protein AT6N2_C3158 [Agrobacterium tumefaciens]